jgi:hypothetical protein
VTARFFLLLIGGLVVLYAILSSPELIFLLGWLA